MSNLEIKSEHFILEQRIFLSLQNMHLEGHCQKQQDLEPEPHPDPDLLGKGTDPRVKLRTKMSSIRNTDVELQPIWSKNWPKITI
jgi:hypothetical protein